MPQDVTLAVDGLTGLSKACKLVGKEASRELRTTLRKAAEPVRVGAETRAVQAIANIGPNWSRMRTGVTTRVVYVAPRERGSKAHRRTRTAARAQADRAFATRLMDRAMVPALRSSVPFVVTAVDRMLVELGRDWERVPSG